MLSTHWNSDHPVDAPGCGVVVWIAYQQVTSHTENCQVCKGYWSEKKWRFESGTPVSDSGNHVCGWLPILPPTYDAAL